MYTKNYWNRFILAFLHSSYAKLDACFKNDRTTRYVLCIYDNRYDVSKVCLCVHVGKRSRLCWQADAVYKASHATVLC